MIPINIWNKTENSPPYITIKADYSDIKLDENNSIASGRIYYDIMVTTKPNRYRVMNSTRLFQADGKNITFNYDRGFPATSPFGVLSTGITTTDSGISIQDVHRGDDITVTMNYNIEIYDVWLKKTYNGKLDTPIVFTIFGGSYSKESSTIEW